MATELPIYQVDAFTNKTFGGNPAAVVPLDVWLPDDKLLKIATENNLAETAFFIPDGDGFHLRWFTPTVEVDLCGHATLATSWVIFNKLNYNKDKIIFTSQSGGLIVTRSNDGLTLDFPIWKHQRIDIPDKISEAMGTAPIELYKGNDWVAVYKEESDIINLSPDMLKLSNVKETNGIIATAKSNNPEFDFVSRCFFPGIGIDEDPVTGSAHCILAPIWAEKLGKTDFRAHQASARGGDLQLSIKGDRLHITGQATLFMEGKIYI